MLFVCVSHFGGAYFDRLPAHTVEGRFLESVALIASPTFVVISGLLLGFLACSRPWDWLDLRVKLVDRGLFMLTLGHIAIAFAHVPMAGRLPLALEWGFITDVIAVGLLIGPFLVQRVSPGRRLVIAGVAYGLAWIVVASSHPESAALERLKEYLVGPSHFLGGRPRLLVECFPLIPWLAVYVAATGLGEALGRREASGRGTETIPLLGRVAVGCGLGALAIKGTPLMLKAAGLHETSVLVWTLGWPFQKQPPSPAYLGVHAGLGLLLLRGLMAIDALASWRRWLIVPAAVGRSSLAVFILQYFLYFTVLERWNPDYSAWWPLLLLASLALVVGFGLVWARFGNNKVFSVGYRWLARPRAGAASFRKAA